MLSTLVLPAICRWNTSELFMCGYAEVAAAVDHYSPIGVLLQYKCVILTEPSLCHIKVVSRHMTVEQKVITLLSDG